MKTILRFLSVVFSIFTSANPLHAQWIQTNGPYGGYVLTFAVSGTNLFAGTNGCVFISTNSGTSWTVASSGLTNTDVRALAVSGTNLFAGTWGGGVFLSTNSGTSWTAANSGLTFLGISAFAVSDTTLFVGTGGNGVWKRPLSEIITSVEGPSADLPTYFSLDQNYPNPFKPATSISFSLPCKSFVSLKVFNALEKEVSILLADELPAGTYARQWNAAALPSGVYFYRLQAGSFIETKKLVSLR